jgi:hypothetical protein
VYKSVMLVCRKRPEHGQAMTEYAIMLALVSGLGWAQRAAEKVLSAEPTTLIAGAAVACMALWLFVSSSRR